MVQRFIQSGKELKYVQVLYVHIFNLERGKVIIEYQ